ncbi:MAG: hypothetical protein Q4B26_02195 [Eubacteriales bacterium]|nr:hypothetical protein [Eubacteriales bacterium]
MYEFVTDEILDIYEKALDCGISIETFWDSSMAEILDMIESWIRCDKSRRKDTAIMCYVLGRNIAEQFGKDPVTPLWKLFPDLFEKEELENEREKTVDLEEVKHTRQRYAEMFNKRRRGEV